MGQLGSSCAGPATPLGCGDSGELEEWAVLDGGIGLSEMDDQADAVKRPQHEAVLVKVFVWGCFAAKIVRKYWAPEQRLRFISKEVSLI